jgi:hypothetical protein
MLEEALTKLGIDSRIGMTKRNVIIGKGSDPILPEENMSNDKFKISLSVY